MTEDSFLIAFSDDQGSLEPDENGYIPNAHIRKFPAMTMPRKLGSSIKIWIDQARVDEGSH